MTSFIQYTISFSLYFSISLWWYPGPWSVIDRLEHPKFLDMQVQTSYLRFFDGWFAEVLKTCNCACPQWRVWQWTAAWETKIRGLSLDGGFCLVFLLTENPFLKGGGGGEKLCQLLLKNWIFLEKPNQQKPMSTAETSQIFWRLFVANLAREHWEFLKTKLTHWNTELQ